MYIKSILVILALLSVGCSSRQDVANEMGKVISEILPECKGEKTSHAIVDFHPSDSTVECRWADDNTAPIK